MKPERDGLASPAREGRRQWLIAVLCGGVGLAVVDRLVGLHGGSARGLILLYFLGGSFFLFVARFAHRMNTYRRKGDELVPAGDAEDLRKVSFLAYLMSIPCYALVLAYCLGQSLHACASQTSALITFVKGDVLGD